MTLAVRSDPLQTESGALPDRCRRHCRNAIPLPDGRRKHRGDLAGLPDDCRTPMKAREPLPDGFRKVRMAIHLIAGEDVDMLGRQARLLRAFLGAQDWLRQHIGENDRMAALVAEFTNTLNAVSEAATAQALGLRTRKAATVELRDAIRRLREHELHLIVAIAAAHASFGEQYGVLNSVRLPRYRMPVVFLLAHARAIRDIVRPFEAEFTQWGCAPGFIADLEASIEEVESIFGKRNSAMMMQVGATAALVQHLSEARRALDAIDAQLYSRFSHDAATWAEWRSAIRVRKKPGRKPAVRRPPAATD